VNFESLTDKLVLRAKLRMATGLHVGSGTVASDTDAPVLRDADGVPYLPGSSIKGVLRTYAERIAYAVDASTCYGGLVTEGVTPIGRGAECFVWLESKKNKIDRSKLTIAMLTAGLCDTCKVFGSSFAAGRVSVSDALPSGDLADVGVERRDGVSIDRDSGGAVHGLKYDFEVVAADTCFDLRIEAENLAGLGKGAGLWYLALLALARGELAFGGKTSRGLGAVACNDEDLSVERVRLGAGADATTRLEYLVHGRMPEVKRGADARDFLQAEARAALKGGAHA
jgi:CRISPR-associated RAMP protein (TIGR02581 family)